MKKSEVRKIIHESTLEILTEKLCPKGKAYVARRKAAGEKHGAYLMGRAVKVCKGQMSGTKKKKANEEVDNSDLDNAVYRLENVYKYLDIEYKETRRGEKYVQINYIPVTSPQSQNPEFVNVRYNNDEDLEIIKNRLDLPMLNEGKMKEVELKNNTEFKIKLKHLLQKHAINLKKGSSDTEFKLTLKHLLDKHVVKGGEIEENMTINEVLALEIDENITEAKFKGKTVQLNKPTRGDSKKFKVYVANGKNKDGSIKVKKVNFGHGGTSAKKRGEKTMKIRKSNPKARAAFRARHRCDTPGPKTMARYWSCKKW